MRLFNRSGTLTMTANDAEAIDRFHWEDYLEACGYGISTKSDIGSTWKYSIVRRGRQHDLAISRLSDNSIRLDASYIRFPVARILGYVGFKINNRDATSVAFEIFEIDFGDELIKELGGLCTSMGPDTNTVQTDALIERLFSVSPNLLLPTKFGSRIRHVFAHFGIIDGLQFLAISSDRFNYDDWGERVEFREIRRAIDRMGGKRLEFLTS